MSLVLFLIFFIIVAVVGFAQTGVVDVNLLFWHGEVSLGATLALSTAVGAIFTLIIMGIGQLRTGFRLWNANARLKKLESESVALKVKEATIKQEADKAKEQLQSAEKELAATRSQLDRVKGELGKAQGELGASTERT